MERLILASRSPRRSELLTLAGIPFEVHSVDVDESCSLPAAEAVRVLSRRKALAVSALFPDRYVLAADTLVEMGGVSFGKPSDQQDARHMLQSLSGRTHHVHSGVTLLSPGGHLQTEADCSSVSFCELSDEEIEAYIACGEPMDKAGAYAIQGKAALFISRLEGSPSSVIGLPLHTVRAMLKNARFPLPL